MSGMNKVEVLVLSIIRTRREYYRLQYGELLEIKVV